MPRIKRIKPRLRILREVCDFPSVARDFERENTSETPMMKAKSGKIRS